MELIFKNTGQTTGFSSWLKSFKEIQTSLLIECDLKESCFISKAFTTDHSVVKYGKISFDDAGFELLQIKDNDKTEYSLDEWNNKHALRIKIGIFMILPKFIQVIDTFSDTDFKLNIEFDIYKNGNENEFHATSINLKSKSLKMKVKDCNISEFEQLSDDLFFNKINVIKDAMSFEIYMEAIKNLMSISSVFLTDQKRDIIKFYTKYEDEIDKWAIYAYDQTNESYDYLLGYLKTGNGKENELSVYRNSFLTSVNLKGNDEHIILSISPVDKITLRIESADQKSFTVLSTVTQ